MHFKDMLFKADYAHVSESSSVGFQMASDVDKHD